VQDLETIKSADEYQPPGEVQKRDERQRREVKGAQESEERRKEFLSFSL